MTQPTQPQKKAAERARRDMGQVRCPWPDCGFAGSESAVDDHRCAAHSNEAQAGSNLK